MSLARRRAVLVVVALAGCAAFVPQDGEDPTDHVQPRGDVEKPRAVAWRCSRNAALCSAFVAEIESKTPEQVKFFLVSEHSAWLEVAAAVSSMSR